MSVSQIKAQLSSSGGGAQYVFNRAPRMYCPGKDSSQSQLAYKEAERESIEKVVEAMFQEARAEKPNWEDLFDRVLKGIAWRRKIVALNAQSADSHSFGKFRTRNDSMVTSLNSLPYYEYLSQAVSLVLRYLENPEEIHPPSPEEDLRGFDAGPNADEIIAVTPVLKLAQTNLVSKSFRSEARLSSIISLQEKFLSQTGFMMGKKEDWRLPPSFETIHANYKAKLDSGRSYNLCLSFAWNQGTRPPSSLSSLLFTLNLPLGSKIRQDFDSSDKTQQEMSSGIRQELILLLQSALSKMRPGALLPQELLDVAILHQPADYHPETLRAITSCFSQAMRWTPAQNLDALQNSMSSVVYLLEQAALLCRGSASSCEQIEQSVYEYHDFSCSYRQDRWTCLEALTSTPEEFKKKYPQLIFLRPGHAQRKALRLEGSIFEAPQLFFFPRQDSESKKEMKVFYQKQQRRSVQKTLFSLLEAKDLSDPDWVALFPKLVDTLAKQLRSVAIVADFVKSTRFAIPREEPFSHSHSIFLLKTRSYQAQAVKTLIALLENPSLRSEQQMDLQLLPVPREEQSSRFSSQLFDYMIQACAENPPTHLLCLSPLLDPNGLLGASVVFPVRLKAALAKKEDLLEMTSELREELVNDLQNDPLSFSRTIAILRSSPADHAKIWAKTAALFARIMQAPPDISCLQERVGELVYAMHQADFFETGNPAICEQMEMALYLYRHQRCGYPKMQWAYLDALTLSADNFKKKYPQLVSLTPVAPEDLHLCLR